MSLRRSRRKHAAAPVCIEDVLSQEILDDPLVDRDALNELLLDPSPLRVEEPPPSDERTASRVRESAAVRIGKLAGLVAAVAMLCGAVVAAAFLDRQRSEGRDGDLATAEITGARALAEFAVSPPTPPRRSDAPDHPTGQVTTQRTSDASPTQEVAEVARRSMREPGPGSQPGPEVAARTFYDLVGSNPDMALGMLDEPLRTDRPEELVRAWRSITHVDIRALQVQPDGTVRADVTMTRSDANSFRVTHLLRIAEGPPPLITEARLLSSLRSPAPAG